MEPKTNDVNSMAAGAAGLVSDANLQSAVGTTPPAGNAPAGTTVVPPVVPDNQPIVVKTPLGTQTFGSKPLEEIVLTSFADVQAFAKDFMNVELKEVKDFVPLFSQFREAQKQAAEAAILKKAVDGYTATINNLPSDVALILNAAISGQDHKAVLKKLQQKSALDYSKPFTAHDTVNIVNFYTGKQFTKESFDALDPVAKEALTDSTKLRYEADSKELSSFEVNTQKATEERQKNFRASVDSSIANMLTSNPQMDKAAVERVRQIMEYGIADVLFTKDKTYVPEAAEKIAMMEFGKETIVAQFQTIGDLVKKMTNEGVSKEREQLLLKGDRPPIGGDIKDKNVLASIIDRETDFLKKR